MNPFTTHESPDGSIGEIFELSLVDLEAVAGGGDCIVVEGRCRETKSGIRCSDTVFTCKK